MATIEAGMWVWMPDDEEAYVATKVLANFKPGEEAKVEDAEGNEFTIPAKKTGDIQQLDPECLDPTDNLVKLNDLNEALILHNLKLRFKKDVIYTYVSSILIAVNPFRMLPIYTPEVLDSYKEGVVRDMPPHIFAIADNAYKSMLDDVLDQAVVISGESGAGKTETMKLVLQYLAEVSGRAVVRKEGDSQSEGLEQQILKANPVMEAFGNAKTLRNNNSSRFGKWTEVVFSRGGAIVGGSIINYLLEKSRLPYQAEGERNYHAFYQLLEGANGRPELKAELKLKDAEDYHYLNQSGVTTVENINDEQDFEELDNAMDVLGMTKEEKSSIFRLVAAILNLGNIEFVVDKSASSEDGSKVKEGEWLGLAAAQLQVDKDALAKCLTFKNIGTRSIIFVPYSKEQAGEARDAMCKTMYGKLFDWLIQKINVSLSRGIGSGATGDTNVIGVLDIFGFESFETNSFEQLCINFCNEKLQFHFNEHIFRLEQEEYASEGINVDNIEFADNQPCLDLLELKGTGVFAMIDEEITVPKGSDDGFLRKVLKTHKEHPNMLKPKPRAKDARKVFIVKHYAGEVPYNTTGFLEKNKDQLHGDMTDVINSSSDSFVAQLLRPPAETKKEEEAPKKKKRERARKKPGKRSDTLGTQFKKQLSQLMKTLARTAPHFVRCMKPNHVKKGKIFESPMMLDQLRYAGLLEVCRIRQIGFPVRKTFEDFHFRYRCLGLSATNHTALLEHLESTGLIKAGQWAVGTSKVFMRNQTQQDLEAAREEALRDVIIRVQRQVRRYNQRARFLRFLEIIVGIKHAVQARSLDRLEHWLNMVAELPYGGSSLSSVKAARELKRRLDEENRVRALLKEAIASRELASVVSALAAAEALSFDCPEVAQARDLKARIEMERKVLAELRAATKARDKDAMTALLDKCDELGLEDADEVKQATALKQRLEEEEEALEELKAAIAQEHLQMLSACLSRMAEMGLDPPEVAVATALRDKLQAQGQARQQLKAAVTARNLTDLTNALRKASETGLADDTDEVVAAKELVERINAENAALAALDAAADAADAAAIDAAIQGATALGLDEHLAPFTKARQVLKRLAEEKTAVEALRAALATNTADALNAAISTASQLGLDVPELGQARAAVSKLGAQNESLAALNAALDTNDLAKVRAAIAHAEEMGMGDAGAVADAKRVADRLDEEERASAELATLTAGDDLAALNKALANATRLNLAKRHGAVVDAAKAQSSKLQALADARAAITSAIKSNDLSGVTEALEAGAALGLTGPEMEAGVAAKAKLTEHKEITEALTAALEAKDKEALTALIERAVAADLDNDKVRSARIIADREKFVVETRLLMEEAVKANDLDKLNVALEKAIELGMEGEDIEAAKVKQEELERDRELAATLVAAVKTAGLKAGGTNPIAADDAAPLKQAIEQAKADGLGEDSPSLKQANDMVARIEGLVALQDEVTAGLTEGTLRQLRELLEKADDLDANLDIMSDVRRRIRELERERAAAVAAGDEPDFDDEEEDFDDADEEERRRARQEKLDKARAPKFTWTKFSRIRDPDDFAKGTLFGKKKVKANQLKWQSGVIKKSITEIQNRKLVKMATRIHKDLLGYAGDKSMSFPATLAQDILEKGSQNPELVDEIYVQVMKHLTENPRPESARAGWQVLCMAVGAFPPSTELENYVLNFILQQVDGAGAVGRYARYALRRLEGIMDSGASGYVPNVEDIQAFKERPPILATIELVDGTPLTEDLPITPDLNVGKVLDICGHFMELQDPRQQYFGIFVQDLEPEDSDVSLDPAVATKPDGTLKTTPRPLQNDSFMGDVVVAKSRLGIDFKFVYKRKVFLRNFDEESEDPMYERLIYLQAADEVILGNIPITDEETVAKLVCDSMIVDLEAEMPEDPDTLLECSMIEYIPVPWREKYGELEWAEKVLKYRGDLIDASPEDLQGMYVDEVKDSPLYGTHFFYVRQHTFPAHIAEGLESELIIAFNSEGLHFLTLDREIVQSFGYADIYRWGGSSSQFSIIIWNAETQDTDDVSMHTTQAADMAALILDYINAIMAAS